MQGGRGPRGSWLVAALALGAGCGSDEPSGLAGIYKVDAQVKIWRACEGPGEVEAIDPPYFSIVDQPLANGVFVEVYRCTGPERASCDETGFPLASLAARAGSEWIAEQLQRSPDSSGMGCFVQWTGTRIIKTDGGAQLRTENRNGSRPSAECAASMPEISSGRALPCTVVEVRDGTRAGM